MKTSTQLKARIRNLSEEQNVQAEIILRNYMLERLLERISASKYHDKFILKGGMLLSSIVGIDTRSTMDMDATVRGIQLAEQEIEAVFKRLLAVPVNDGVVMTLSKIETIHDEADYPGLRITIQAILDKTRQTIKVDLTTGDLITPHEVEHRYKLMLEERSITVWAYNIETVLAEKLESILSRGTTNTRMRDYYDVHMIMGQQPGNVDTAILQKAFRQTADQRGSYEKIIANGLEIIKGIAESDVMFGLWNRYRKKYPYASNLVWKDVVISVGDLFDKIRNR